MLTKAEIECIKDDLRRELLESLRAQLSAELTGATGRLWKKIEKKLSESQR